MSRCEVRVFIACIPHGVSCVQEAPGADLPLGGGARPVMEVGAQVHVQQADDSLREGMISYGTGPREGVAEGSAAKLRGLPTPTNRTLPLFELLMTQEGGRLRVRVSWSDQSRMESLDGSEWFWTTTEAAAVRCGGAGAQWRTTEAPAM